MNRTSTFNCIRLALRRLLMMQRLHNHIGRRCANNIDLWICIPRPAGGGLVWARDQKRLPGLFKIEQWPLVIRESSRVKDLNAGIMFAIERRMIARAASLHGIIRIVKPKTEVIDLDGINLSAGL
jgi:hypothetical protein